MFGWKPRAIGVLTSSLGVGDRGISGFVAGRVSSKVSSRVSLVVLGRVSLRVSFGMFLVVSDHGCG